ncbi:MAG: DUF3419 family protein [Rhabdochlamydiaceae bacterium]|nr:DUF3419 family protein [Candidatus Amphrikana amoebophyrae]
MTSFYSILSYSFGNEDWRTEQKALQIKSDNHIVCVTASGDRPLNLLSLDCAKITAVDANSTQNHLLDLKKSAMKNLDYYSYIEFLGLTSNQKKKILPRKVFEDLNPESKEFWIKNMKMIEKGIIYQGQLEKSCANFSKFIYLMRGMRASKLTSFDDIEDQRKYIIKSWDKPFWRNTFKLFLNPKYSKYYIDDPGLCAYVSNDINPGEYIYDRMNQSLKSYLAKENPLFSLVLNGRVEKAGYSPYIMQEHCVNIKKRLDRLHYKSENMIDFLESQEEGSIDRFSFSDIASYMDEKSFNRMLRAMIKAAAPGARFCARQFLSDHSLDDDVKACLYRDEQLEQELEKEDRCFVYRFMTGEILKANQGAVDHSNEKDEKIPFHKEAAA